MSEIPVFISEVKPKSMTVGKALQKAGHATVSALVKLTGKDSKNVQSALKTLYTGSRIHIGDYVVSRRGQVTRVWYWGDGDDKHEPIVNKSKEVFVPHADVASAWLRNPI